MSFENLIKRSKHKTAHACQPHSSVSSHGTDTGHSARIDAFSTKYPSQFFNHDGDRLHFIDTGEGRYARTALCLHSRLGWAYSFRKIIPRLVYHGFRVVAADLFGFGLSDKSDDVSKLSIARQTARIRALVEHLGLAEITLIGHEMGASMAVPLPQMMPNRIEALIFANPVNQITEADSPGLHMWRTLSNARDNLDAAREIARICPKLTPDDLSAYNKPLMAQGGQFGLRHFNANIVLDQTDADFALLENGYHWLRNKWDGRTVVVAGTEDPMFGAEPAKQFCEQIGYQKGVIQLKDVCGHPFEEQPGCIDLVIDELFAAR